MTKQSALHPKRLLLDKYKNYSHLRRLLNLNKVELLCVSCLMITDLIGGIDNTILYM